MFKYFADCLILSIVVIVEVFIWWYSITLLLRTNWAQQCTSIGNDVIIYMYILCAFACFCSIYMAFKKGMPFPLLMIAIVVIFALLPSAIFVYLNVSGKVKEFHKIESCVRLSVSETDKATNLKSLLCKIDSQLGSSRDINDK